MGGFIAAAVGAASKEVSFVSSFFAGQSAGDRALKRLREEYAAARKRRIDLLDETLQAGAAANLARAAGAGVEVSTAPLAAGRGQAKTKAADDLKELERQYVQRRDAIWAGQQAATANFTFSLIAAPIFPPSLGSQIGSVLGRGEPFTSDTAGVGPPAGAIEGITSAAAGRSSQTVSSPPAGDVGGAAPASSQILQPASSADQQAVTTILGTRPRFAWYSGGLI